MPQPPNLGALLQQAQKMQEEMMAAQEKLKDERVEASAGGGMVKVVMTGDLELKSLAIDPDAVDPEDVEMLQDMVLAAVNEALRQAMELQSKAHRRWAAWTRPRRSTRSAASAAWAGSAAAGGRPRRRAAQPRRAAQAEVASLLAPPVQRLVTELGKLPGIGNRTAQRLAFHLLRASPEDAHALADAIRDVKERISPLRGLLQPGRGPALHDLPRRAPRPRADLRRRGAGRRDPGRAHARVPRPLPRARRRALADRRRRARDLKIAELYARVERADPPVREVVLATNPTTTGEATALHIADGLRGRAPDVAVTRLASGLPVGGDLEYADEVTLGRAFAGRRAV